MITIPPPVAVTTAAKMIAAIPPGVCSVVLSNTGSTNVVYVGTSNGVTASGGSEGFPLPAGQTVTINGYPSSAGGSLYAISAATGNTVGVIISTAF